MLASSATLASAQESSGFTFRWRDHPSIQAGAVRLEMAARAESDLHLATPAVGRDDAEPRWPGPRVEVRGRVARRFEFELSREFGRGSEWKDLFANVRIARSVEIAAGRFKIPFGRETLVSRASLDFINRTLGSTALTPSRDVGAMVHGRALGRWIRYHAGLFNRDGDNARTGQVRGAGRTAAFRVVSEPVAISDRSLRRRLQVGLAVADSRIDRRLGLRGQTLLEDGVFFDRIYVNGRRRRFGLDALWSAGPASLGAEFIRVSEERENMGFHGEDLTPLVARAWHLFGTWAVTGERKNGRLEPRRTLTSGGPGAVELVARIEELRFSDTAHPAAAFDLAAAAALKANAERIATVGVNWYLTRNLRLQHNYVFEWIADPSRSPAPTARGRFGTAIFRLQLTV